MYFLVEWSSKGYTTTQSILNWKAFASPIVQEKDFKIEIIRQEK